MADDSGHQIDKASEVDNSSEPAPLANGMIFCQGCGKQMHNTARSCPSCGAVSAARKSDKTKWIAALLAFFLGGLGVHRFYLGNAVIGILYLLFCWTFIPAIIAFCEFIYFLAVSEESFDRKYNYR
jgi:TM2 domain-containing membrane protein YozV